MMTNFIADIPENAGIREFRRLHHDGRGQTSIDAHCQQKDWMCAASHQTQSETKLPCKSDGDATAAQQYLQTECGRNESSDHVYHDWAPNFDRSPISYTASGTAKASKTENIYASPIKRWMGSESWSKVFTRP
jgi:hypothetical protein